MTQWTLGLDLCGSFQIYLGPPVDSKNVIIMINHLHAFVAGLGGLLQASGASSRDSGAAR
jgi:hypothetical protein